MLEDNGAMGGWEAAAPPIGEVEGDGATGGVVGQQPPTGWGGSKTTGPRGARGAAG